MVALGIITALLSAHIVHFGLGSVYALVRGDLIRHPAFHKSEAKCPRGPTMDNVRVVDAVHGETWEGSPPYLRMWENNDVHHERGCVLSRADTAVVFAWAATPYVHPSPGLREFWGRAEESDHNGHDPDGSRDKGSRLAHRPPSVNSGTRKLVINLSLESDCQFSVWKWILAAIGRLGSKSIADAIDMSTLSEIVINFVLPPVENLEVPLICRISCLLNALECFATLRSSNAKHIDAKCTVVNSAAIPSALLQAVHECCPVLGLVQHEVSFKNCAEALFNDSFQRWGRRPTVEYILSEEYEARVGTERYRIETMEQPW